MFNTLDLTSIQRIQTNDELIIIHIYYVVLCLYRFNRKRFTAAPAHQTLMRVFWICVSQNNLYDVYLVDYNIIT